MLKRDDYLTLIEEIRNTDKKSLDEYIEKVLEPLRSENRNFIEILYKDIHYLLNDLQKEDDLVIENGDLVIEDGDLKLTGYESRLRSLSIWLHIEICNKFIETHPLTFTEELENFEENYLNKSDYTPEFKSKLDALRRSIKKEKKLNSGEKETFWQKLWDLDNIELKPNVAGVGVNLNNFFNKFR
ncbi:hypothetical protein [Xanthocytophaga flava]|uniref:hypothetical protein n=1 Tax=Xanthocytophaga flava TaxID=3048013 RepID=UPI0028D588B3|nr:hypothetical protein [Xanthocytophaga flavus]MDJ1466943.1 hypothetical protein [Xanthocytophaga flavus]